MRRAVNTPDRHGRTALVAGRHGAEHPGGIGRRRDERHGPGGRRRGARAQRRRQRQMGGALEDGAHRAPRVGDGRARPTSAAASFPPLTYTDDDAARPAPAGAGAAHRARRARSRSASPSSTATPSARGMQAAALKPADFFGNDDVLYLMEDMATGEIRVSILWEWLHKQAPFTDDDDGRRRARRRHADARAVRAAARRGVRQAAGGRQPRRARRLEARRRSDRARHRRGARDEPTSRRRGTSTS